MKKLLIIAGSDSGGGAGIQADIKTATIHKTYCATIITSLTAQNTIGVKSIFNPEINFLRDQFNAVLDDIKFDAVKIGMLANSDIINVVADFIEKYQLNNIVLDPVMVATSGDVLLENSAIDTIKNKLINKAKIITPNIDEAEILANIKINNLDDMVKASEIIKKFGAMNVLIKGGHLNIFKNQIINILNDENDKISFIKNKKIPNHNFHGTGCSLSSSIACNIIDCLDIVKAVRKSNRYTVNAIKNNMIIGSGSRVLRHY